MYVYNIYTRIYIYIYIYICIERERDRERVLRAAALHGELPHGGRQGAGRCSHNGWLL